MRIQLTEIKKLVEIIKSDDTKYKVIEAAYEIFTSIFDHNIRDLKKMFPDNHVDESGQPFWSGPKRCPQPVVFDSYDEICLKFIFTTANLIFASISMPQL